MIIFNATLIVEPANVEKLVKVLREEVLPRLSNGEKIAGGPRMTRLVELPADPTYAEQAASLTLQYDFPDAAAARAWGEKSLQPELDRLPALLGGELLSVASLLEVL